MASRNNAADAVAANRNPAVSNDDYITAMENAKMASRNNTTVNANATPDDDDQDKIDDSMATNPEPSAAKADDVDAIPDGLDDEGAVPRSLPQTNGASSTSGMGLDRLKTLSFNEEQDEHTRKMLNPPAGDWVKSERWKTTEVVYAGDCLPGDVNSDGRTMLIFTGDLEPRVVGDIEYAIKCSLRVSPDLRYKVDKPNEVDTAHRLFIKAKDLYIALHDTRPTTFDQLISMFEEDRYIVRTMNGDNGPIALDIKDPKTAQRRTSR